MATKSMATATALSLVALTLAACGSKPAAQTNTNTASASDAAPTASASFDPCGVLTADEVAAVTADKVAKTEVIDHDCHYHTTLDDDGTVISIYPTGGTEEMKDIQAANKLLGGIGEAVSGQGDVGKDVQASITPPAAGGAPAIGDETVWQPNDVLAVRKGDLFVGVTPPIAHDPASHHGAMLVSDADKRSISQKLAEAVLAKLGH